ncbi:NAD-binding protein [Sulfurimonas sp. SAG-AH-194-L11]|nr:TrkA C-terminal domain-containing protein [Sulfurimonas sp. SAG-AH-194-L11]MDF1877185.1 NAD-binding protein [Sulfurimonas sp. SAG-AH-194-L11]
MSKKTALIFGFNQYSSEIAINVKDKYDNIELYSLDEKNCNDSKCKVEYFDLSDEWSHIEKSVDVKNSIAFCVLEDTAKNIFLTISLRAYFSDLHIIAIASNKESANKLLMAGASKVVPIVETTAEIIANMLELPISNKVLHSILFEESALKIAQIEVTVKSDIKDEKLLDVDWTKYQGIIVLSIMHEDMSSEFIYSSKAKHHIVKEGDTLVVVGYENDIKKFRKNIRSE